MSGLTLNGKPIADEQVTQRYAANGGDTRMHTNSLGPFLEYHVGLNPSQLQAGVNELVVTPTSLRSDLTQRIHLMELELLVTYPS